MALKYKSLRYPRYVSNSVQRQQQQTKFSPQFLLPEVIQSSFSPAPQQLIIQARKVDINNFVQNNFFIKNKKRNPYHQNKYMKEETYQMKRSIQYEKCKTIRPLDSPFMLQKFKTIQKKNNTMDTGDDKTPSKRNGYKQLLFQSHNINVIKSRHNSIQMTDSFENIVNKIDIIKPDEGEINKSQQDYKFLNRSTKVDSQQAPQIIFKESQATYLCKLLQISKPNVDQIEQKSKTNQ